MAPETYTATVDPYPKEEAIIEDVIYLDNKIVFHRYLRPGTDPLKLWRLGADLKVRVRILTTSGDEYYQVITAPEGMETDLASVPKRFWDVVGPIGAHLGPSIIHDYLFVAWSDFRKEPLRRDFRFANNVFDALMRLENVRKRWLISQAVESDIGWATFKHNEKPFTLAMNDALFHMTMEQTG